MVKALGQIAGAQVAQPFGPGGDVDVVRQSRGLSHCGPALDAALEPAPTGALVKANGGSTDVASWTRTPNTVAAGLTMPEYDAIALPGPRHRRPAQHRPGRTGPPSSRSCRSPRTAPTDRRWPLCSGSTPGASPPVRCGDTAPWLFFGLVFGLPELGRGGQPAVAHAVGRTIGHLETLWPGTPWVVVVVLIALVAYSVARYPPGHTGGISLLAKVNPRRARTGNGRLVRSVSSVSPVQALVYIPLALGVVAVGSLIAAVTSSDRFVLGYVLYGLFAIFCVIIPNLLAYWFARDVPFPTFFRTIADLDHRSRPAAMIIVAWLVVLAFHLAFFPWPDLTL